MSNEKSFLDRFISKEDQNNVSTKGAFASILDGASPGMVKTHLAKEDEELYVRLETLAKEIQQNKMDAGSVKIQAFHHQEFLFSQYKRDIEILNRYIKHLCYKGMFDMRIHKVVQLISEYTIDSILVEESTGFKNVRKGRDVYVKALKRKKELVSLWYTL